VKDQTPNRMPTIRVAIVEDHQSIIDGYTYRLKQVEGIEIVAAATNGSELKDLLSNHQVDVLLLDINVPTSPDNPNPYPILQLIPQMLQKYRDLNILVISMYAERALVKSLIAVGISGYILKDDREAIHNLGRVVQGIADSGIYFSSRLQRELAQHQSQEPLLTPRQLEILSLFSAYPDLTSSAAALKLNIAHSTIRNLLSNTYLRLGVRNRSAAIMRARQLGLLTAPTSIDISSLQENRPRPNVKD